MFDDSAMGVRLAWVELLAWTKAHGRAGCVRLRGKAFAKQKNLTETVVEEMLVRATGAGAITRQGDVVTLVNWREYQDPKYRHRKDLDEHGGDFTKTPPTTNRGPSTSHLNTRGPSTAPDSGRASKRPRVSEQTLRDFQGLRVWFDDEIRRPNTTLNDSGACWQNVKAAAAKALYEHAAGKCNNAVALFKWICGINQEKKTHWDHLDSKDDDLAQESKAMQATGPPGGAAHHTNLKAILAAKKSDDPATEST